MSMLGAKRTMIVSVVMAGGQGWRIWPLSTPRRPKQFCQLIGNKTLLQLTADRMLSIPGQDNVLVVTLDEYVQKARRQLPDLPPECIISEPFPKNTGACVCLCALLLAEGFMGSTLDDIMVVCPSDHYVADTVGFVETIMTAVEIASEKGKVATIGITPSRPETGYGYIKVCGDARATHNGGCYYQGEKFVEKPDYVTAKLYLEAGDYFWNSGIFVWRVDTVLGLMSRHMQEMYDALRNRDQTDMKEPYTTLDPISIDYGIMEKLDDFTVVPALFDWDDLGSWAALERFVAKDGLGNAGKGETLLRTCNGCFAWSETKPVVSIGVSNVIIVETEEFVLVCAKDNLDLIPEIGKSIVRNDGHTT